MNYTCKTTTVIGCSAEKLELEAYFDDPHVQLEFNEIVTYRADSMSICSDAAISIN